jgi:multidrug efflux pump
METKKPINEEQFKEFGPASFSVKNVTTVYVLTAIIFLSGLMAYISMPSETFPEIVIPEIYIGTPYPGNSPTDIEKLITRPLEKEINGITGIDEITSTSVEGYSTIFVEFDFEITPQDALAQSERQGGCGQGQKRFPQDLPADPNVFEMNFSELIPIQNINLSGDFDLDQLKEYAEYLEEKIEDLPEISKVEIRGVLMTRKFA